MGTETPGTVGGVPTLRGAAIPRGLSVSLGFLLSKAAEIVASRFTEALKPYGISPREYGVLSHIFEYGPQAQHQIGEHLRIDRTTMVSLIDSLEAKGLGARIKDESDRRRNAITLTGEGEDLFRSQLSMLNDQVHADALSIFSPAEAATLIGFLQRLVVPTTS
jgi:DNA-binding MarR family transcriptional regulator